MGLILDALTLVKNSFKIIRLLSFHVCRCLILVILVIYGETVHCKKITVNLTVKMRL